MGIDYIVSEVQNSSLPDDIKDKIVGALSNDTRLPKILARLSGNEHAHKPEQQVTEYAMGYLEKLIPQERHTETLQAVHYAAKNFFNQ